MHGGDAAQPRPPQRGSQEGEGRPRLGHQENVPQGGVRCGPDQRGSRSSWRRCHPGEHGGGEGAGGTGGQGADRSWGEGASRNGVGVRLHLREALKELCLAGGGGGLS